MLCVTLDVCYSSVISDHHPRQYLYTAGTHGLVFVLNFSQYEEFTNKNVYKWLRFQDIPHPGIPPHASLVLSLGEQCIFKLARPSRGHKRSGSATATAKSAEQLRECPLLRNDNLFKALSL